MYYLLLRTAPLTLNYPAHNPMELIELQMELTSAGPLEVAPGHRRLGGIDRSIERASDELDSSSSECHFRQLPIDTQRRNI